MRIYTCQRCSQLTYFENTACTRCGATLAFTPENLALTAMDSDVDGMLVPIAATPWHARRYRHCINRHLHATCNWAVDANDPSPFCVSCRLNRTIPDLSVDGNLQRWQRIENEKRRLIYSLLRLGLPVTHRDDNPSWLLFDFLADTQLDDNTREPVYTGHENGLITLNIAEADSVHREKTRTQMAEPYRTLLGHFRHESGHYYWDRLVKHSPWLEAVRETFGDDRVDYSSALDHYYHHGARENWQSQFVSAYASAHPWEDWAETWAHYLHIIDTLEMAHEFGLRIEPRVTQQADLQSYIALNPYEETRIETLIDHWLPLTYALNSLNRSMGHEPLYPFVLSATAIQKLTLVHHIARGQPLQR